MANMSYCRFENTKPDLADCVSALERIAYDNESISAREWNYAKQMRSWCESFIDTFDDINEDELTIL